MSSFSASNGYNEKLATGKKMKELADTAFKTSNLKDGMWMDFVSSEVAALLSDFLLAGG
jgi:hypothetical protein